jgi:hypothetical protein
MTTIDLMRDAIICGSCDEPASKHGREDGIVFQGADLFDRKECYRQPEDIGFSVWTDARSGLELSDYRLTQSFDSDFTVLNPDVSGPSAEIDDTYTYAGVNHIAHVRLGTPQGDYVGDTYVDEIDYVSPTKEWDALDRWTDKARPAPYSAQSEDEWICTPTLEQMQSGRMGSATEVVINRKGTPAPYANNEVPTEDRNAVVEGNHGFLSIQLLDEVLTEKYHRRLLNMFTKDNEIRVGSMAFRSLPDGKVSVRCVQNNCNANKPYQFDPRTATREFAETLTLAVISHGNNHAAKWFTERETFYKVHKPGCDIHKCDPKAATCDHIVSSHRLSNEWEVLGFLKEHARYCSDSKCFHELHIMALSPAKEQEVAA